MGKLPVVRLSNGLRVANFSSPHSFNFVDGSVLPACTADRSQAMALDAREIEVKNMTRTNGVLTIFQSGGIPFTDIYLEWEMTKNVKDDLYDLMSSGEWEEFDILLVPLPVMQAIKKDGMTSLLDKARCVRIADRVTKAAHIDRFCL